MHQCCRSGAQSSSRFHVFVGGAGVCHRASNICPLLTQAQHHFRVKQTVYPSLETNYQVRTVKRHTVLITPALLPWHMFYCPGCLHGACSASNICTGMSVLKRKNSPISKVSTADTFIVSVQLLPLRRQSALCSQFKHKLKGKHHII